MARHVAMCQSTKENKMKIFLPLCLLLVLWSCSNSDQQQGDVVAESPKDSVVIDNDNQDVLRLMIPNLFEYFAKQDSSFIPANFIMKGTAPLNNVKAYPVEERLKQFHPYLIYNSDSSLAIDLYSYNYTLQKGEFEAGEPDSEAALVDFKSGKRKRLLFTGPGISFMDAKWMTANEILIAGAEEINTTQIQPLLWKINLQDSAMELYKYKDTLNAKAYPYTEQKLKPAPSLKSI